MECFVKMLEIYLPKVKKKIKIKLNGSIDFYRTVSQRWWSGTACFKLPQPALESYQLVGAIKLPEVELFSSGLNPQGVALARHYANAD